jgi:hypothetical protein
LIFKCVSAGWPHRRYEAESSLVTVGYSKQKARARGKVIQKTPTDFSKPMGDQKREMVLVSHMLTLLTFNANIVPRRHEEDDLLSFKMFGEHALKKLAIIRGDMCKLYSNTET